MIRLFANTEHAQKCYQGNSKCILLPTFLGSLHKISMAFFNLTQLGPQNPFHSASSVQKQSSSEKTEESLHRLPQTVGSSFTQPLPSLTSQLYGKSDKTNQAHKGSHTKFAEMRIKHQRNDKGMENKNIYVLHIKWS